MATKAQIQTLINTELESGQVGGITAVQHRDVLKDDANSFLEAIYGDAIFETKASESILTTSSANLYFEASITKVGRDITVSGFLRNDGVSPISPSINITDNNYKCVEDRTFYGSANIAGESVNVTVFNSTDIIPLSRIAFSTILLQGEIVRFLVTYASNL